RVVDPGFNAILIRSCADLASVADALGASDVAARNRARAARARAALEGLWSEAHGQYLCRDRTTGALVDSASVGGLLPAFAAVPRTSCRRTIGRTRASNPSATGVGRSGWWSTT